ncbi:hypothetical protein ACHMW6_20520 [Pseudoduganella sp. UC29_106]|uniref:hypothetical protein n=1 Tax=Pseudoduganella sp. UC29_106 TaxID=3374553 RepID=UPI003757B425
MGRKAPITIRQMLSLLMPAALLLGLCLLADTELEAALTALLSHADAGQRLLVLLNLMLGALALPALGAAGLLLTARHRRHKDGARDFPTEAGKS